MKKVIIAIVLILLMVMAIAAVGCKHPTEAKPREEAQSTEETTEDGIVKNSDGSIELPIIWG